MEIRNIELTGDDLGAAVTYIPDDSQEKRELGTIAGWNSQHVFVDFCDGQSEKVRPQNLIWDWDP